MEERIEYQVLVPDSVAWFVQAALTADWLGNVSTRDLALAEAHRIADERRLVEQPAPDGSRVLSYDVAHECNGVRLAELERRMDAMEYTVRNLQRLAQGVHGPEAGL